MDLTRDLHPIESKGPFRFTEEEVEEVVLVVEEEEVEFPGGGGRRARDARR